MSAMGTSGIALLVALICCIAFLVFKKRRSNLLQAIQDNNLDGLLSSLNFCMSLCLAWVVDPHVADAVSCSEMV